MPAWFNYEHMSESGTDATNLDHRNHRTISVPGNTVRIRNIGGEITRTSSPFS
jgi:hypothetical protein